MKQKKTAWIPIIVAITSFIALGLVQFFDKSTWTNFLALVPALGFIIAMTYSCLLNTNKYIKIVYYFLIGVLIICFLQSLVVAFALLRMMVLGQSAPTLFGTEIMNSMYFNIIHFEAGVQVILLAIIFIMECPKVNWMVLGSTIGSILNIIIYVLIYTAPILFSYFSEIIWKLIAVVTGSLWIAGAIIMGIRGLKSQTENAQLDEEVQHG